MELSFRKQFYLLATTVILVFILIVGKSVLFPLALGLLVALILLPMATQFETWGLGRRASTATTLILVSVILFSLAFYFSSYMADVMERMSNVQTDMGRFFSQTLLWVNEHVPILPEMTEEEALELFEEEFKERSGQILGSSLSGTGAILSGAVTTLIFTFFFLLYRRGLTNALVAFAAEENRSEMKAMYLEIQLVGQKYLSGMLKLISILGILNGFGLMIIGVQNPFLFGFMAAFLSIIPYVGTAIGAIIPVIFTFVTQDVAWMPLAVLGWFGFVQFLEGNFLSPVIVGKSLDLNALVAFLSMIIGAVIWGVGGMIIFLPFIAMLRVVADRFKQLEPLAHLLSEEPYGNFLEGSEEKPSILERIKAIIKS